MKPLRGLIRSIPSAGFSLFLFLLFFMLSLQKIHNYDLFWHLGAGRWIVEHGAIPRADPFSFTRQGQPWIDHAWLSQLIFHGLHRLGGWNALIIFKAVIAGICFLLLDSILAVRWSNRIIRLTLLSLIWVVVEPRLTVRPEILTAFLSCLLLVFLHRFRWKENWNLLWIAPLFALWFNLHAAALAGLSYFGLWCFGEAAQSIRERGVADSFPLIRRLAAALGLSLGASLLTPRGGLTLWYGLSSSDSGIRLIQEWLPPEWSGDFTSLWIALLGGLSLAIVTYREQRWSALLPALVFLWLSLMARRQVLFYGFALTPLAASAAGWTGWSQQMKEWRMPRLTSILSMVLAFLVLPVWTMYLRRTPYGLGLDEKRYPVQACRYLSEVVFPAIASAPPLRMLNAYHFGGFLIHALYPRAEVSIDGRTRLYGEAGIREYAEQISDPEALYRFLHREKVDLIVLPYPARDIPFPVLQPLIQDPRWPLLFFDDASMVFVSKTLHDTLRQSGVLKSFDLEGMNPLDYLAGPAATAEPRLNNLLRMNAGGWGGFRSHHYAGTLLSQLGRWSDAIEEYRRALEFAPDVAEVWYNLGNAQERNGEFGPAVASYRTTLRLKKDWPETENNLGLALYLSGRAEEAEALFEALEERFPDSPEYMHNRALVWIQLDRGREALERFEFLASLQPPFPESAWELGRRAAEREDWEEACRRFAAAYTVLPENPRYACDLTGSLLKAGRYEEAERFAGEALRPHRSHPSLLYNLACARARLENVTGAREALDRCFRAGGEAFRRTARTDPDLQSLGPIGEE